MNRHAVCIIIAGICGLLISSGVTAQSGSVASSPYWQISLANGAISSLRYDPTGQSRYGSDLVDKPLLVQSQGANITLSTSDLVIGNGCKSLTIKLPKTVSKPLTMIWPIRLSVDGYYDRLSGKTFKSASTDDPALTRFIAGSTGHTIMIESYKRVNPDALNADARSGLNLANQDGHTVIVMTRDNTQFILNHGSGGRMRFTFVNGELLDTITSPDGSISLQATNMNKAVQLERGELLPHFTFGKDTVVTNSVGGKTSLNRLFNDFYQQAAFWFPYGTGHMLWGEWGALGHAYVNGSYRNDVRNNLSKQNIGDDGYGHDGLAYAWGDQHGWPFPGGYDTRLFYVGATQISAIRHYLMWTGEYDRLKTRDYSIKGFEGQKASFARTKADSTTSLLAGNTYYQKLTSPKPFDRVELNLMVLGSDPVLSQDGITKYEVPEQGRGTIDAQPVKDVPGQTVAQVIKPSRPFNAIGFKVATYASAGNGGRLRAFKWSGNYQQTLQQKPLFERRVVEFQDCLYAYLLMPQMMPAGTEILAVLDEPTKAQSSQPPMTAYFFYNKPGVKELGPMFVGDQVRPDRSMDLIYCVRNYPGAVFRLRNSTGKLLVEKSIVIPAINGYFNVPLDKSYPAGSYTFGLIPNGALMYWNGATMASGNPGGAYVNGHSWDWLQRARRMMDYQMEYLNVRKEGVPKYDGHAGDKDHLGLAGRSVGSNYYDILPFGYYDAYGATWLYHSLDAMVELEKAYGDPEKSAYYRTFMQKSRSRFNELYWSDKGLKDGAARYIGTIDVNGGRHDYGFTVLNTMAVTYGLAPKERALAILNRLDNGKTLDGKGVWHPNDIYKWQFAPRMTTIDNQDWWAVGQKASEFPWGDQIQNGGADLYESFYDLMARLKTKGADDAYKRLMTILRRYSEPDRLTGYSPLFTGGSVQGGQAGGVGIMSSEFPETSLLASIVLYGFLGADARPDGLHLAPKIPSAQPSIQAQNIFYHGTYFDIEATRSTLSIKTRPVEGRYDFIINGKRLNPPFIWTSKLGKSGECVVKPMKRK